MYYLAALIASGCWAALFCWLRDDTLYGDLLMLAGPAIWMPVAPVAAGTDTLAPAFIVAAAHLVAGQPLFPELQQSWMLCLIPLLILAIIRQGMRLLWPRPPAVDPAEAKDRPCPG